MSTKLRQACQNFILHVRRTFRGETTLLAQIFHHFRNSSKRFSEFWQEFSGRVVTTAFCVPRWNFFLFFEGEKWRKKYFLLKNAHCYHFQTLSEKTSLVLLQAWLRQASQKIVVHVQTKILQINFLEGLLIFPHFRKSSKNFSEFRRENFGRVVTTTFIHVHRNIFRKVIFLSKSSKFFFPGFRNLSCKCVDSQRKLFATVVKIAFSVAKESFSMKNINLFKKL